MSTNKSIYNLGDKLLLENNKNSESRLIYQYLNLALNRFIWKGLPETIESRHIEKALVMHGQSFVYDHNEYGLICLPCQIGGKLNIYGEPVTVNMIGHGESFTNINIKDGVYIKSNNLNYPLILQIKYYSELINSIDVTIRKNIEKLKTPYIITTTKENEKSYRILLNKINNNEDEVFIDSSLSNGGKLGIEILNTNVPMYVPQLQSLKHDLECDLLSILGLNNTSANNDKKERLLVDEINVNNGEIMSYLDVDFQTRQKACDEINKKFNLNVTVEKNILLMSKEINGGDMIESIHDDN